MAAAAKVDDTQPAGDSPPAAAVKPGDPPSAARELLDRAERALAAAGVDTPRLDAELLLAHALGTPRPRLIAALREPVPLAAVERFAAAVARRETREPLAYITGEKGFRGIDLLVDSRALIPRPETELLVEVVAATRPRRVLDVATGSGAVALALADELPDCRVTATDVSPDALALAAQNAARLGLADRVTFAQSDLLAGVTGEFDAIAANPPYVKSGEINSLQPEIGFEPRVALDGGADGLALVRELVAQVRATGALAPGGVIALEIGDDQGPAAAHVLATAGFGEPRIHRDLNNRDRVVAAIEPR